MTTRRRTHFRTGGMHAVPQLSAARVEELLHGAPDPDAQRDARQAAARAAQEEARALRDAEKAPVLMARREAAIDAERRAAWADLLTPPIEEDHEEMNKREKIFKALCDDEKLRIVSWGAGNSRIGGLVEAGNGRQQRFSMSRSGGDDNPRGDLNLRGELRRFARENAESLTPVAQAMLAAANDPTSPTTERILKVAAGPVAPRVHLRKPRHEPRKDPSLMLVKDRTFMPSSAKAPAPALTPTPAPIAAPSPVVAPARAIATPTPPPLPPEKSMPATQAPAATPTTKLTRAHFYSLTKWLETADTTKAKHMPGLAEIASAALNFKVPSSTMKEAAEILGLDLYKKPAKPLDPAVIVAAALVELMKAIGHTVPVDLAEVAEKASA